MKKSRYCYDVSMGNMSIVETEMRKKAMANFLKSLLIKPHISKVRCGESPKADYYYSTEICYDSFEYLRVLRFAESLHAFCSFWQMSLFEHCLHQLDE